MTPLTKVLVRFSSLLLLFAMCASPRLAFGQIDIGGARSSLSNFYFAKPNELTIIVNIIGFVQRPGRYEISSSIDLPNLLSLAGGPISDGTMKGVKISRFVKNDARLDRKEVTVDLDDLTKVNFASLVLQNGDIIEVDRSGWATFRDVVGVVMTVATLTVAVATVINVTQR
jgi:hypothetical protein